MEQHTVHDDIVYDWIWLHGYASSRITQGRRARLAVEDIHPIFRVKSSSISSYVFAAIFDPILRNNA